MGSLLCHITFAVLHMVCILRAFQLRFRQAPLLTTSASENPCHKVSQGSSNHTIPLKLDTSVPLAYLCPSDRHTYGDWARWTLWPPLERRAIYSRLLTSAPKYYPTAQRYTAPLAVLRIKWILRPWNMDFWYLWIAYLSIQLSRPFRANQTRNPQAWTCKPKRAVMKFLSRCGILSPN